jgi:predicted membrane protein
MDQNNIDNAISRHRKNRVLGGLVLIGIGAVLFADKMGVVLPPWLLTWPMLLIVIGLYSGIKHGFRNASWLIILAVGSIFLWDEVVADVHLKQFTVPIILIAVGLLAIVKPRFGWSGRRQKRWERRRERWGGTVNSSFGKNFEDAAVVNDDYIDISCVFSGVKNTVLSKTFKGGKISCVFGGAEIDLTKADIQGTAVLDLHEVFGGVTLIIPSNWAVKNDIEGVFHGVDDRRNNQVTPDGDKLLILQGSAVLAGVEIKSY